VKIDNKLNLVLTINDSGGDIYIHSTPISKDVFEQYYLVLSRAYAFIYSKGMYLTAPRIAHLVIKQIAEEEGVSESVNNGLINDVIRRSNVIYPSSNGYVTTPLSNALSSKLISDDQFSDVKGMLFFFIVVSAVAQKELIEPSMLQITDLWGYATTYSNVTELKNSLQKLIEEQISSPLEVMKLSSIPI
jgi:hypothetical protein